MSDVNPKEKCAFCGLARDEHWGFSGLAKYWCTGFVSKPLPFVPLSLETATYIRDQINIQSNKSASFIDSLARFHETSPNFVSTLLEFLQFCEIKEQPNYSFLELNIGQD